MTVLTRTQQRHAKVLERGERRKALAALKELLGSSEVKDMLPRTKIKLGTSSDGGETYRLYLKRSGLHKEWDYDHYKSGTGQYGALGPGEFDYTETRSSAVQPSLKTIQDFGLNEAKLREVQAQLRA